MKPSTLDLLACTSCDSSFVLRDEVFDDDGEIMSGTLLCDGCGTKYPIEEGLPLILSDEERVSEVGQSFGFEWQTWHDGGFETDTVFGRKIDEDVQSFFDGLNLTEADIVGKVVLDAGCGSGALTSELARRYPDTEFVAVDLNPAAAEVQQNSRSLANLRVVRASIFELPFHRDLFDIVWSNGVIHHTGDTVAAFKGLTPIVKPGGRLYVWVYERKVSPFAATRAILLPLGLTRWPHPMIYRLSQALARVSWLAVRPLTLLSKIPGSSKSTKLRVWGRDRGYGELVITWFDVLSPAYRDTYKTPELASWFRIAGFDDLSTTWWPVGVAGTKQA